VDGAIERSNRQVLKTFQEFSRSWALTSRARHIHGRLSSQNMMMHIHAKRFSPELTRTAYCLLLLLSCCPLHVVSVRVET
jgi:hypothetical protein